MSGGLAAREDGGGWKWITRLGASGVNTPPPRGNIYRHGFRRSHGTAADKDVSPEVWDEFVAALKRGPTPEQIRAIERAEEIARGITLKDSSIVKKKRICRPGTARSMEAGACTGNAG